MKKILIIALAALSLFNATSCEVFEPKYAEEVLLQIIEKPSRSTFQKYCLNNPIIEGYQFIDYADDYEYLVFCCAFGDYDYFIEKFSEDIDVVKNEILDIRPYELRDIGLETDDYCKYYKNQFLSNIEIVQKNLQTYKKAYNTYVENWRQNILQNSKIHKWILDTENTGENYTGYLIIYSINGYIDGTTIYALVRLIEHDENGEYQYELIDSSESLLEIEKMIQ